MVKQKLLLFLDPSQLLIRPSMKRSYLLFFLLLSQIALSQTKFSENQKLVETCKIWGFLKYYHPEVASGKTNWDEQLFKVLPQIEKAKTKEEFSKTIETWIDDLGAVALTKNVAQDSDSNYFLKNLNLVWIKNKNFFSEKLSKKLQFIVENRFQGINHYIISKEDSPYPIEFVNELEYPNFQWTDKNLRILALFRYWNYVEYFFPYKYQMDQNWDEALAQVLPNIYAPNSEKDFVMTMRELSVKLNDTHASTYSDKMSEFFGGEKFLAFSVKIIDEKAVITRVANDSLAKIDDLKVGDVMTKFNGKTIHDVLKENEKYIPGSNKSAALPDLAWVTFSGNTNEVEIEYIRDNITGVKKVHRYNPKNIKRKPNTDPKWKFLEDNIGYVNMGRLEVKEVKSMMDEFKNAKAIIFDIRNRPKETHRYINEYLNPEPKVISSFIIQDLSFPGRYIWRKENDVCGKLNPDYYKGKVIVLVNEVTLSHAEYTTMSFQTAPNTTVIGSQTSGADGANYPFDIIKGFSSSFTSQGVFYPNKKETQRVGIAIDVEVKPTILGIQQGKDEVLDRAKEFIKTGK